MALASRPGRVVKEGEAIVSVNTVPKANLTGTTEYQPKITDRPERTAVVDTGYIDASRFVTHISGGVMPGVFYHQVLAQDDTLRPQALDANPTQQQYHCYRDYMVRVTSPIVPSIQDQDSREFPLTFEADMYHMIRPNDGDMWVADIGGGHTGIFTITSTELLSYTKQAVTRAEFKIVAYDDLERLEDLERKSIRTYYYDESLLDCYSSPFLSEDAKTKYDTCNTLYRDLKHHYLNTYWDSRLQGYRVPTDPTTTLYDPLHADYCRYIGLEDVGKPATEYAIGALDLSTVKSIWWLLKDQPIESLPLVTSKVKPVTANSFKVHYRMRNIAYSLYNVVLYPIANKPFKDYDETMMRETSVIYGPQPSDTLYPQVTNTSYVLSEAFYTQDAAKFTLLELAVSSMLKKQPVAASQILELTKAVYGLSYTQQFYYIPILLTLVDYVRRRPLWL